MKTLVKKLVAGINSNKPALTTIAAGAASTFGLHLPAADVAYMVAAVAAIATWVEKF